MRSVVQVEIEMPKDRVVALYADPENSTEWMDDIDRYEAIRGKPGLPGSKYRLVPKHGSMVFVATVLDNPSPDEVRLELEAPKVTVSVTGRFGSISAHRTRLTSVEVFQFKGMFSRLKGVLASAAIQRAHRRHMAAFARFAEAQSK
jgi:hypothetical protein